MSSNFDPENPESTLKEIYDVELNKYSELIRETVEMAGKQYQIQIGLERIEEEWKTLEIDIKTHKQKYFKMKSPDSVFKVLESHMIKLSSMKTSSFAKAFQAAINKWDSDLNQMFDTLELLQQVQRQWIYLESIFASQA